MGLIDLSRKVLLAATAVVFSLTVAEVSLRLFNGAPPRGNINLVASKC